MVLDIEVNSDSVKKLEKFLGTGKYKDLATNTQSFSRKLNEERKMRIPYVDGQVLIVINPYWKEINDDCINLFNLFIADWGCAETLQQQQATYGENASDQARPAVYLPPEKVGGTINCNSSCNA